MAQAPKPTPAKPSKSQKATEVVAGRAQGEPDIEISDDRPVIDDLRLPEDTKLSRWQRFKGFIATHRTRTILVIGLLIIAPVGVWAYIEFTKPIESVSQEVNVPKKPAKPATKASPLTGNEIEPERADRPVTAVVIENHPDARPQSGLGQAGVVYEALAEGGITRFLAFFLENQPAQIGPVRSLRTYFVDWTLEFNAPIAHVGGNAEALALVGPLNVKDMNQFAYGNSFNRTSDRRAPHNVYTSSDKLDALQKQLGFYKPASFTPSPRTTKDTPSANPLHPNININYSYNGFQVDYKYDATCNCYARLLAGQPHIDRLDNQPIKVKNIVVEYMPTSYGKSRIGEQLVTMATPGQGRAIVFRDGEAIEGTWSKAQHSDRTKLVDSAGKEIPLNKGNTWYSIVPTDKTVSY